MHEHWVNHFRASIAALRLNQHFPSTGPWLAHSEEFMELGFSIRTDTGMPDPTLWHRSEAARRMAVETLAQPGPWPDQLYLQRLAGLPRIPLHEFKIDLRKRTAERADYRVVLDCLDNHTGLFSRYTLLISHAPGHAITDRWLELEASAAFTQRLAFLSHQDAAVAFAALHALDGFEVDEVVRGTLGPMVGPACGPTLREFSSEGLIASASLERASRELHGLRVDDPLALAITAGPTEFFGVHRQRKWAVPFAQVEPVREYLRARGAKNLVYGYKA